MGREIVHVEFRVVCSVSRHNSEEDEMHDALVEELRRRLAEVVQPVVEDLRYADVVLYTDGLVA